jgi:hypothetical protein
MDAKLKIKVIKCYSKHYWYADKIGEQFEVDIINNDGNYIVNNIGIILKKDAEIVVRDSIVDSVISQFKNRSNVGIKKYGKTLDRNDLSTLEWLHELKCELMDAVLYLERTIKELEKK